MKSFKKFIFLILSLAFAVCLTAACGGDGLKAPGVPVIDYDEFTVSWDAVSGARSYTVEVTDGNGTVVDTATPRKTSYSYEDLTEGTYSVRVRAENSITEKISDWSVSISFTKEYDNGCTYTLINNDAEYELTKAGSAKRTTGDVVIDGVYKGKPVTRIADGAFKGKSAVTSVIIGENVEYIGENAFRNCSNLAEITIPSTVNYIGKSAFYGCVVLNAVTIPQNVTEIGDSAFGKCQELTEITIPENVTKIGASAFSGCSKIETLVIPDGVTELGEGVFANMSSLKTVTIGSGVTEIPDDAFVACEKLVTVNFAENSPITSLGASAFGSCSSLVSLDLPDKLESIGYMCFANNASFKTITIPDSVTSIARYAFANTPFYVDSIGEDGFVYADKWLLGATAEKLTTIDRIIPTTLKSGVIGIADGAFYEAPELSLVRFPDTLRYIGGYAFFNCVKIYRVDIPEDSVISIGEAAFANCALLDRLNIENGLKTIGSYAFYNCTSLANFDELSGKLLIPDSVEKIGTYSFYGTKMFEEPDEFGLVYAGHWLVGYYYKERDEDNNPIYYDSRVTLKDGTIGISNYAFFMNETISNVVGLGNVKIIGRGAFYGCTRLSTAALNINLKKIEDYTFYGCSSLRRVELPQNVEVIGRSAFYRCAGLTSVNLSECRVKEIMPYAFFECYNITEFNFGRRLEKIGDHAFFGCFRLGEGEGNVISLPTPLTEIGGRAFSFNMALQEITFGENVKTIGDFAFNNCRLLTEVNLPDSVETIGKSAFYNCISIENVNLGNVKRVGDFAFFGSKNIDSIVIPSTVTYIGTGAFKGAMRVESVTIGKNVKTLGANSFYGAKNATFYIEEGADNNDWQRWNSSYRPVVYGVASSDGYVVGVTVGEITNLEGNAISAPVREGYIFKGWTKTNGSTVADYTAKELSSVAKGTVLYAVWEEGEYETSIEKTEIDTDDLYLGEDDINDDGWLVQIYGPMFMDRIIREGRELYGDYDGSSLNA